MGLGARRATVVATISVLTVASLGMLAWTWFAGPIATAAGSTATLGGLSLDVQRTEWTTMNHAIDSQGGYQMPDQMMPGGPTGNDMRLGVRVTLTNTRASTQAFELVDEFTVTGGLEPEPRPLVADTVGDLNRIGGGAAMQAVLYFDVEVPDVEDPSLPPLFLQWDRGGDAVQLELELPGDVPEHDH